MAYVIVFLFAAAVFHFVYESIIAPTLLLKEKYRLFRLRDELRELKMAHGDELDDKHYEYMESSINSLIRHLQDFDLNSMVNAKIAVASDKELARRVEERSKILDDCRFDDMRKIRKESIYASVVAFLINFGGWGIYLMPVFITLTCFSSVKAGATRLLSLSDPDFNKVRDNDIGNSGFAI